MRLLGRGQKLCFVGTEEVQNKIIHANGASLNVSGSSSSSSSSRSNTLAVLLNRKRSPSIPLTTSTITTPGSTCNPGLTSLHVLRWVMANTVEANLQVTAFDMSQTQASVF